MQNLRSREFQAICLESSPGPGTPGVWAVLFTAHRTITHSLLVCGKYCLIMSEFHEDLFSYLSKQSDGVWSRHITHSQVCLFSFSCQWTSWSYCYLAGGAQLSCCWGWLVGFLKFLQWHPASRLIAEGSLQRSSCWCWILILQRAAQDAAFLSLAGPFVPHICSSSDQPILGKKWKASLKKRQVGAPRWLS